jgi:hypothetical protein
MESRGQFRSRFLGSELGQAPTNVARQGSRPLALPVIVTLCGFRKEIVNSPGRLITIPSFLAFPDHCRAENDHYKEPTVCLSGKMDCPSFLLSGSEQIWTTAFDQDLKSFAAVTFQCESRRALNV